MNKRNGILGTLSGMILAMTGCSSVHTELIIEAPPAEIWVVLMDTEKYAEWNPILIPKKGEFKEETKIHYEMISSDGKRSDVSSKVVKIEKEKLINQFGGIPLILTFDHTWTLEAIPEGTKVIQHEEYRGIGDLFWNKEWVKKAYARANKQLRARVLQRQKKDVENAE